MTKFFNALINFATPLWAIATKYLPQKHLVAIALLTPCVFLLNVAPNDTLPIQDISTIPATNIVKTFTPIDSNSTKNLRAQDTLSKTTNTLTPLERPIEQTTSTPSPTRFITTVKPGDNLSVIFTRAGLSAKDVYNVTSSSDNNILNKLYPGYELSFELSSDSQLTELEIVKSQLESFIFSLNDKASFDLKHVVRTPTIESRFKTASIQDSLFLAAQNGGISAPITMALAGIFSGVIDFLLDTRAGDTFNVLYEEEFLESEFIGTGNILATQFINRGEIFTALRYKSLAGDIGYFNQHGESMRKAFLRNPIDYVRISSSFNPSRRHPVQNTIRAHKGTDYAAPRGTPIVATSDGRVTWAARNGSFGKLIVIQHGQRFETKYAHLSDYARNIKKGSYVKQGQTIGYVGTTGSSTGPHLHYELLMDGIHRDSRAIHEDLPKANSIPQQEMARFREQTSTLLTKLNNQGHLGDKSLALNSSTQP